jgi:DNA-binding NarL/FixJ family response regulator
MSFFNVKAIIADDHPLFRAALTQAVEQSIKQSQLLEANEFPQVMALLKTNQDVELVFLDLNMPGNDGFYGLTTLRNHYPDIMVIMVSALEEPKVVNKAVELGASAYIPKSASLQNIINAIGQVLNGETWLPEHIDISGQDHINEEEKLLASKLETLSPSQFKVLQHITNGLLNKQIAYEMQIQETTVKQHVSAILQKLGVHNRTQAGIIFEQLKKI